jgi:hypothetical protein
MKKAQIETISQDGCHELNGDQKASKRLGRDSEVLNGNNVTGNIACKNKNEKRSRSDLKNESSIILIDDDDTDESNSEDAYLLRDILNGKDEHEGHEDLCVICCLPYKNSDDEDSSESLEKSSGWDVKGNEEQELSLICIGRYISVLLNALEFHKYFFFLAPY